MSEPLDDPQGDEPEEGDEANEPEAIDGPPDPVAASAAERDGSAELIKKAERTNQTYTKRLRDIFGKDTPLFDCVHCGGLGITFAPEEAAEGFPDVVQAEDAEPCPKCNALGLTKTGSLAPGQETKPCGECGGRGWKNVVAPLAEVAAYQPPAPDPAQPLAGQWVPGRGFVPYGSVEPIPGSLGQA